MRLKLFTVDTTDTVDAARALPPSKAFAASHG